MRRDLFTSIVAVVALTIMLGLLYPLAMTGIGQVVFPGRASGSLIEQNGHVVGSKLIGQDFRKPVIGKNGKPEEEDEEPVMAADPAYFQERPSTATSYNAAGSSFTNAGPNSLEAGETYKESLKGYLELERPYDPVLTAANVPIDAVTSSASGVDPEISRANAGIQAHRVAAVRRLPLAAVEKLIEQNTKGRFLGLLGEPGVNVLELNIAVEKAAGGAG
jgi:potassium-transporting ATPase KdpC subunit